MKKVHPNAGFNSGEPSNLEETPKEEAVLTVWKKSLLLSCDGFTVFDGKGDLVFRVDNYMQSNKRSILLMDANGKPLLTIRRKKMSLGLGDNWLVYEGEETTAGPRFSVKKSVNILNNACLAYVIGGDGNDRSKKVVYEIEGSYSQRRCTVLDDNRRLVAEIRRKEGDGGVAFGTDVFRLVVKPDSIRTDFAMAFVILLDQMF
ncbi:Protein LURP-one-related 8 [Hibiscus syriacus]|uniref:Protein LURP-one-related 8 n=1 Tax=Hibiscus syriacus TaxID=106335 RepID=A0A6A2XEB9_HIBSY|nr:protein LURP-one-related 8-like [Hibiscus syriacus]KAE8673668.1 Protein LURP-one-related 8 [Hibiscus syriacus]